MNVYITKNTNIITFFTFNNNNNNNITILTYFQTVGPYLYILVNVIFIVLL